MKLTNLEALLVHEVRDLLYAEKRLVKALPKMVEAANDEKLRDAFEAHLQETRHHVERLEKVADELGIAPRGEKCEAMEGLLREADEILENRDDIDPDVLDAALIAAAQRVEHYEMAGYGCARTFAKRLGFDRAAKLLQETLDEEGAADKKLTKIAESGVNKAAVST